MNNWRVLQHPIGIAIVLGAGTMFWCSIFTGAFAMLESMDGSEGGASLRYDWNWPYILASMLWIMIFTSGIMGCGLYLIRYIRSIQISSVSTALNNISEEEYKKLQEWMFQNEMSMNRVISLWRSHHGSI